MPRQGASVTPKFVAARTCENFPYSFKAGLRPTSRRLIRLRCVRSSLRCGPGAPRQMSRHRASLCLTTVSSAPRSRREKLLTKSVGG